MNEGIKKMSHTQAHTEILFNHKERMKFCYLQQIGWPQGIMLFQHEKSQIRKDKYCKSSLTHRIWKTNINQAHRQRKQIGGCQRWETGKRGEWVKGAKICKISPTEM